ASPPERAVWRRRARFYATARQRRPGRVWEIGWDTAQSAGAMQVLLVSFVDNYGKVEENKGIAGQITTFLSKAREVEPCPPANSTPRLSRTDNQLAKPLALPDLRPAFTVANSQLCAAA